MPFNPAKHHRRSVRLPGYDYARAGAYFVTICVQNREHLFGNVSNENMRLNELGCIAAECWEWLVEQYPYVELDEWVVMPNHLHGIIVIHSDRAVLRRGDSRIAPTDVTMVSKTKPLGRLIGAFKTVSTKRINESRGLQGVVVWQRNYYERIIRDPDAMNRIREYIRNNPMKWDVDSENRPMLKE